MKTTDIIFAELKRQFDESGRHCVQRSNDEVSVDGHINVREIAEAIDKAKYFDIVTWQDRQRETEQCMSKLRGSIGLADGPFVKQRKPHMVEMNVTRKKNGYLVTWSTSANDIECEIERNGVLIAISKDGRFYDHCLDLDPACGEPAYKVTVV